MGRCGFYVIIGFYGIDYHIIMCLIMGFVSV